MGLSSAGTRLLYTHLSGLGDYLLARPALMHLKERFPGARLSVTVQEAAIAELARHDSFVDQFLWYGNKRRFLAEVRDFRPTHTFTSACDIAWVRKLPLLCLLSGARHRTGSVGEPGGFLYTQRLRNDADPCVLRECALVGLDDADVAATLYRRHNFPLPDMDGSKRTATIAVINPLTGRDKSDQRKLPDAAMAAVLAEVLRRAPSPRPLRLAFIGIAKDRPAYDATIAVLPPEAGIVYDNLAGRTSLMQAAAELAKATVVLSADTGTMHLADMLGRRVVSVFFHAHQLRRHRPFLNPTRAHLLPEGVARDAPQWLCGIAADVAACLAEGCAEP